MKKRDLRIVHYDHHYYLIEKKKWLIFPFRKVLYKDTNLDWVQKELVRQQNLK
jgi:hypothetical protein